MSRNLHPPSKYSFDASYPEIKVAGKNPFYASLLQDDYAGRVSEFGAIAQYLYHHFWFEQNYPKLADLLSHISLVEMHHMELLGETIILLGGDPKIGGTCSTAYQYWNGSMVNYGYNVIDRLQGDLQSELDAIKQYTFHASVINDKYIKGLLERIILDEEVHVNLFQKALKELLE